MTEFTLPDLKEAETRLDSVVLSAGVKELEHDWVAVKCALIDLTKALEKISELTVELLNTKQERDEAIARFSNMSNVLGVTGKNKRLKTAKEKIVELQVEISDLKFELSSLREWRKIP
jgi:hypothetical protein